MHIYIHLSAFYLVDYHCKTVCKIGKDTAPYKYVINSVYTVDEVYDGVIWCCIPPYFTYGFAVLYYHSEDHGPNLS